MPMLRRSFFTLRPSRLSFSRPQALLASPFSSSSSKMTSDSQNDSSSSFKMTSDSQNNSSSTEPSPRNALPAPGSADNDNVTTLDVSGAGTTVKLDGLGPLVVNVDGTMSRIANWDKMAEIERQNTLRIIGKRNQQRLAALREARGISEGSNDSIGASGNHDTPGTH